MTVVENRYIVEFNEKRGMLTPFLHRSIFTRRKGHYAFRERLLFDGLHPKRGVVEEWRAILSKIMARNQLRR